jgi:hypothetical protein
MSYHLIYTDTHSNSQVLPKLHAVHVDGYHTSILKISEPKTPALDSICGVHNFPFVSVHISIVHIQLMTSRFGLETIPWYNIHFTPISIVEYFISRSIIPGVSSFLPFILAFHLYKTVSRSPTMELPTI